MDEQITDATTQETEQAQETQEAKTYSEAEFQAEIDRRITQAMQKAQRKADARVKEAEKLAQMSAQEKYEYELTQRERAIEEKEHELAIAENKAAAAGILSDKGISPKLVEFVVAEDADTMNHNITLLEAEFKASVKAEVERRLQTSTPKKNLPMDKTITREEFQSMSLTQQAEIFAQNPNLYAQLTS